MKMPIGKFKGQPVEKMTTAYLAWLVTRDHIRFKYWTLIKEALRILRQRFNDFEVTMAELEVKEPPPEHWKTPERSVQKKRERAEKLRRLEEQRAREAAQYRLELQMRRQAEAQTQRMSIIDASQFARTARLQALQAEQTRPADPNDVSDLV